MEKQHITPRLSVVFCFLALTLVNFFLAYSNLSLEIKLPIGIMGLAFLLWILFRSEPGIFLPDFKKSEWFPAPGWLFLLLLTVSFLLRFWKLGSLFLFPQGDEAQFESAAIQFIQTGHWQAFYYRFIPGPFIWAVAFFLKIFHYSLFGFWFVPATVSFLTVGIGILAAGQFFSKSFAFLFGGCLAINYWGLDTGRILCHGVLLPAWELFLFYGLGKYLQSSENRKNLWAALLGFFAGLGYLTFPSWVAVSFFVVILFFYWTFFLPQKRKADFAYFISFFFVSLFPFTLEFFRGNYGQHIRTVAAWSGWFDWRQELTTIGQYFSISFWGVSPTAYGPSSGGFLNPFFVSCFFTGWVAVFLAGNKVIKTGLIFLFLVLFLPGILSMNMEPYRLVQLLPWLCLFAAFGLEFLLGSLPPKTRLISLTALFILSSAFDWARIIQPYQTASTHSAAFFGDDRSTEKYRAYQILEDLRNHFGPGLVFPDFLLDFDESLRVGVYPFNALENPALAQSHARWAAVLMDSDYYPFLKSRWPGARWIWLDADIADIEPRVLAIIPVNGQTQSSLNRWMKDYGCFENITQGVEAIQEGAPGGPLVQGFLHQAADLEGDRFLQSCFWERMSEFDYFYLGHPYETQLEALRQSIRKGYPAAHLYYRLGCLLMRGGRYAEARQALLLAEKAPMNHSPVSDALDLLHQMEKTPAPSAIIR